MTLQGRSLPFCPLQPFCPFLPRATSTAKARLPLPHSPKLSPSSASPASSHPPPALSLCPPSLLGRHCLGLPLLSRPLHLILMSLPAPATSRSGERPSRPGRVRWTRQPSGQMATQTAAAEVKGALELRGESVPSFQTDQHCMQAAPAPVAGGQVGGQQLGSNAAHAPLCGGSQAPPPAAAPGRAGEDATRGPQSPPAVCVQVEQPPRKA